MLRKLSNGRGKWEINIYVTKTEHMIWISGFYQINCLGHPDLVLPREMVLQVRKRVFAVHYIFPTVLWNLGARQIFIVLIAEKTSSTFTI